MVDFAIIVTSHCCCSTQGIIHDDWGKFESIKSPFPHYWNSQATKRTFVVVSSAWVFNLKIHLVMMSFLPRAKLSKTHVCFFSVECISCFIASTHLGSWATSTNDASFVVSSKNPTKKLLKCWISFTSCLVHVISIFNIGGIVFDKLDPTKSFPTSLDGRVLLFLNSSFCVLGLPSILLVYWQSIASQLLFVT